jgi:HlyD family secretion protein
MNSDITGRTETLSEEVQDIVGIVPSGIVRRGMSVLLVTIVLLIIGSFVFKYPDVIEAPVKLTGSDPAADIAAKTPGQLIALFVVDKQKVKQGDVLGVIENACNYEDLLHVKKLLDQLDHSGSLHSLLHDIHFSDTLQLGELQNSYSDLSGAINRYLDFLDLHVEEKTIDAYRKQINAYNAFIRNLEKRERWVEEDLLLAKKQLYRDSVLLSTKTISEAEYDKAVSFMISKQKLAEESDNLIHEAIIKRTELEFKITETELIRLNRQRQFELEIVSCAGKLKAEIRLWEQHYLLISPIDGALTFKGERKINQIILTGEILFTVVPDQAPRLEAYTDIPVKGSGKVKPGQTVHINLDDYPYTEYGMLTGKVETISQVRTGGVYNVRISMPDSLITNYHIMLPFKQNMSGKAEIITDNIPLAGRLILPIKRLFYRNVLSSGTVKH